jgi:sorbitol/mannitol transport system permease protein
MMSWEIRGETMEQANTLSEQKPQASLFTPSKAYVQPSKTPQRRRFIWLHIPALVFMVVMTQIPFLLAIWFSLHSWNLLLPSEGFPFVGLSNYVYEFVHDPNFWPVIGQTIAIVMGATILALFGGTILAMFLDRPFWGKNVLRGLATIPFLVTPAAMMANWKNLFLSPNFGIIDWLLHSLGLPKVSWLSSYPMESIIIILAWEWTPFVMLVILAGLQSVPNELYEAARVDGAGEMTMFRRITLPMLRKAYEIALLFGTIFIFQTFSEIFLTTSGGPGAATMTLPYYTYQTAFIGDQIGLAAALGVIGVVIAIFAARGMLRLMTAEER